MIEALSLQPASGYSEARRDFIRARMIGYMKRHRIGVPTLLARIAEATGRSQFQISQKTLQNFLAGKRRTNDGFVKMCDEFVRKAVEFGQELALGYALGAFFGEETGPGTVRAALIGEEAGTGAIQAVSIREKTGAGRAGKTGSLSTIVPGIFDGMSAAARAAAPGSPETRAAKQPPVPYATLIIEPSPHDSFVPVREEVFNWDRAPGRLFDESAPRRAYRGYAVMCGAALFVLARNILTGGARTYWLAGDEKRLDGRAIEAPFPPYKQERGLELDAVRVTYLRKEQG